MRPGVLSQLRNFVSRTYSCAALHYCLLRILCHAGPERVTLLSFTAMHRFRDAHSVTSASSIYHTVVGGGLRRKIGSLRHYTISYHHSHHNYSLVTVQSHFFFDLAL